MGGVVNVAVVVVLTVGVAAVVNGASVVIDDDVKLQGLSSRFKKSMAMAP